jgi:hypothetical protein
VVVGGEGLLKAKAVHQVYAERDCVTGQGGGFIDTEEVY